MDQNQTPPNSSAGNTDGISYIPASSSPTDDIPSNGAVASTPVSEAKPADSPLVNPTTPEPNLVSPTTAGEPVSPTLSPTPVNTSAEPVVSSLPNSTPVANTSPQPAVIAPTSDLSQNPTPVTSPGASPSPDSSPQTPFNVPTGSATSGQSAFGSVSAATFAAPGQPSTPNNQAQPVFSSNSQPQKKRGPKKLLLLIVLPLLLLAGGASATYFGYVVPNKPENIWSTSMSRMGKMNDKLVEYVTTPQNNKATKVDGSFSATGPFTADGSFNGQSDGNNSQLNATVSSNGIKVSADIVTIKSSTQYPDLYFRVSGIKGLGGLVGGYDPSAAKTINSIDGQWYLVDHSLLDKYSNAASSQIQITRQDVNDLIKKLGETNKKYLFSSDPKTAVLVVKQNVGKVVHDGRHTYHFKVGYNKTNLKAYYTEFCNNIKTSKISQALGISSSQNCSSAGDSVNDIKDSYTSDVWVDMRTKLIHVYRFSDTTDPVNNYADLFQNYQGGDEVPFGVKFHTKDSSVTTDAELDMTLNFKTNAIQLSGTYKSTGSNASENESGNLKLNITPTDSVTSITKPKNAKNLLQLLDDLGVPNLLSQVSANQQTAKDTERITDLKAIASHLEVYYAQNGFYPTLANLDSESWRAANLKGLDKEATRDPDGSSYNFSPTPAANIYAYKPSPSGCDNLAGSQCKSFTLGAVMSNGKIFTVNSLSN